MNTLLAANQLPDLFTIWGNVSDVVGTGCLMELSDLINQYAPNIQKDYENIPELSRYKMDGGIYTLAQIRRDDNWEPVSYTHLDVYKRQHYAHYGEEFGKTIAGFFSDEPELGNGHLYATDVVFGKDMDFPWSAPLEDCLLYTSPPVTDFALENLFYMEAFSE